MLMKNEKKYYQLIPENIFQNLSIIDDLIKPEIKGYSSDNLKEIISIVACHLRKNEKSSQLQITYLKKLVAQGDKYLKALMDLNIVQRSGHVIIGKASYKYNFSEEYESRYLFIPLNNPKLISRIEKAHSEIKKRAILSVRGNSEQVKFLKSLTLSSDYTKFIETESTLNIEQYNSIVASATRILNGDIYYSIENTSGRFHSNITNLSKLLRPFLRINNEPLVNLDIKNSQPYLSTIVLTNPRKVALMTKNAFFTLLLQSLRSSHSEDVMEYISLVVSGQIYECLMEEFSKNGLTLSREQTKGQVLRILFARNRSPKNIINRKARLIFKKRFPHVHKTFSKIRGSEKGDSFHNFKRFAILLQRIESHLILEVILKRIYRDLPGTIAVSIHDSIMTGVITNNVEAVRNIMMEELTLFVGFPPNIRIEGIMRGKGKEEERG